MEDLESSSLSPEEKVLLRFVENVNNEPHSISQKDIQGLHQAGWSDEQIYYAMTVCALFNFYNRWVDAAGVHALSDEGHREGAKRSAAQGYVRK